SIMASKNGERHSRFEHVGHRLIPIPIWRERLGPWLVPHASSPIFVTKTETVGYVNKLPDFAGGYVKPGALRKVEAASGPFKSYRLPRRLRVVDRIVWFAVARSDSSKGRNRGRGGHMSRLRSRLKKIYAIGEDCNIGYGAVDHWDIEPIN